MQKTGPLKLLFIFFTNMDQVAGYSVPGTVPEPGDTATGKTEKKNPALVDLSF